MSTSIWRSCFTPSINRPPRNVKKTFKIGVILHKNDISNNHVREFVQLHHDVHIIDIMHYKNWYDVILQIQECEMVMSSSLHGLIISDAYHIPNVWVKFSDDTFDGSFKYLDYLKSVGRKEEEPLEILGEISFSAIYKLKESYSPIYIDLEPLLSVCPFLCPRYSQDISDY